MCQLVHSHPPPRADLPMGPPPPRPHLPWFCPPSTLPNPGLSHPWVHHSPHLPPDLPLFCSPPPTFPTPHTNLTQLVQTYLALAAWGLDSVLLSQSVSVLSLFLSWRKRALWHACNPPGPGQVPHECLGLRPHACKYIHSECAGGPPFLFFSVSSSSGSITGLVLWSVRCADAVCSALCVKQPFLLPPAEW